MRKVEFKDVWNYTAIGRIKYKHLVYMALVALMMSGAMDIFMVIRST